MAAHVFSVLIAVCFAFSPTLSAQSTDATLSDLKVNGTTIASFSPNALHYDYNVTLNGSPAAVPSITTATPNSAAATVAIANSTSLVETAKVTVTAQDGVTKKVYTVHYKPFLSPQVLDGIKNASHPRVYLNAARVAQLKSQINAAPYSTMWLELKAQADVVVAQGVKGYVATTDPEELWQRTVGDNLTIVAFAWLMSGNSSYLNFARAQALETINYDHWGTTPDLASGHLLAGVGTVYDWCFGSLSDTDKTALKNLLITQGNRMHGGATLPTGGGGQWWQDDYMQNHLWVSMAGLNVAGMAVIDESNKVTVAAWLRTAMDKFSRTMYYLGDDGASHEGPSYWNYGVEHLLKFADLAKTYYKYNLFEHMWFAGTGDYKISMFYPRNAWTATSNNQNFGGDAEIVQWGGPDYLLRKLAAEYQDGIYQWYADQVDQANIENPLARWLNLLWFDSNVAKTSPHPATASLPSVQYFDDMGIVSMRSNWSGNESVVNFKCGPFMGKTIAESGATYDLGAGHVHPDTNHFTIFGAGEWQLKDDGYSFKATSNHNTLLTQLNGTSPLVGQLGDGQLWFQPAALIAANAKPSMKVVQGAGGSFYVARGDGKAAYPGSNVSKYNRFLIHQLAANILIVVDDIALNQATYAELRFFPQSQTGVSQSDGSYFLAGKKSNLRVIPLTQTGMARYLENVGYATRAGPAASEAMAVRLRKGPTQLWKNATAFIWESNDKPQMKNVKWFDDTANNKWKFYTTDNVLFQFDWNSATYGNASLSANVTYPTSSGSDVSLAGLFVGGQRQSIVPNQTKYSVTFAGSSRVVPTVVVAPNDPDATVTVTQATSLPGTAFVTVKSSSNANQVTYSIGLKPSDFNADGSLAVAQVTSTTPGDATSGPDKAIDGIDTDTANYWASNAAAVGGTASITFDLGRTKSVNRVDIAWRPANSRAYIYSIQTSTDNVNWTTVVSSRTSAAATTLPQYQANSFGAVSTRYVRINGTDNTQSSPTTKWITLCEVKLFGAGAPQQNLALGKTVAYSTSHNDVVPSRLTNGLTTGSATDLVAVGAAGSLVSATVDLGQTCMIEHLKMWHYWLDGRKYRDVVVQLSTTSNFSSGVTTVFNNDTDNSAGLGVGSDAEYIEEQAGKDVPVHPIQARYARFYLRGNYVPNNNWNHYVELQAFGFPNAMPVAHAGSDQTIHIPAGTLVAGATLNGSQTTDANSGDTLTYTWTGSFGTVSGVTPSVTLPLGTNKIKLHVSDGKAITTDEVTVSVVTP